jgi:hypothetical protein
MSDSTAAAWVGMQRLAADQAVLNYHFFLHQQVLKFQAALEKQVSI